MKILRNLVWFVWWFGKILTVTLVLFIFTVFV